VVKPAVQIDNLSKGERLALMEQLWDSLSNDADLLVPPAQRSELAARARALQAGNLEMLAVDDVLEAIRNRGA